MFAFIVKLASVTSTCQFWLRHRTNPYIVVILASKHQTRVVGLGVGPHSTVTAAVLAIGVGIIREIMSCAGNLHAQTSRNVHIVHHVFINYTELTHHNN